MTPEGDNFDLNENLQGDIFDLNDDIFDLNGDIFDLFR